MMGSLKNLRAIKEMLVGEHKTQTKIQITKGERIEGTLKDKLVGLEPGEFYTDDDGKLYEKLKGGGHISHGKLWESRLEALLYENCPKQDQSLKNKTTREKIDMRPCKANWNATKLDVKMKNLYGMCFDCKLKKETEMRIDGTWEQYEKDIMKQNAISWLGEAEKEKDIIIQTLANAEFVNSSGLVEKWSTNINSDELKEKIENEFKIFKEEYLKQFDL